MPDQTQKNNQQPDGSGAGLDTGGFRPGMPICVRVLLSRFRPGSRDMTQGGVYLLAGFAITITLLAIATQLPSAPYNLRELFATRSLWLSLPLFSAFLLWSTGMPNLVARVTIICPALHLLQPLLYLVFAYPAWLMLSWSVSAESLIDVFGEPMLGWPEDRELFVRFLALAGPIFLSLFAWNLLFEGSAWISRGFGLGQMVSAVIFGLPLLWLSKYIVVDRAATDRIIMLSAQGSSWRIGGALALAMVIVTMNGVILGWMSIWPTKRRLIILAMTPLLLYASWQFLSIGLSADGITLLLGAGPEAQADRAGLLLRWTLLYSASVTVIALAHLIPFRLRGNPMSQREAYSRGRLHNIVHRVAVTEQQPRS